MVCKVHEAKIQFEDFILHPRKCIRKENVLIGHVLECSCGYYISISCV